MEQNVGLQCNYRGILGTPGLNHGLGDRGSRVGTASLNNQVQVSPEKSCEQDLLLVQYEMRVRLKIPRVLLLLTGIE